MKTRVVLVYCALLCLCLVSTSNASSYLVVDVDGAVEDFALLTTILQHPTAAQQLRLVTINGAAWGSLKTVERNMKRFLSLYPPIVTSLTVAVGARRTLSDQYNSTTKRAACEESQGVPQTPTEALRRGMKVSQYDVSRCFGQDLLLPAADSTVFSGGSVDAVSSLVTLLGNLEVNDRVTYVSTTSLTNLAVFLQEAERLGLLPTMLPQLDVHLYENGNNFALDRVATDIVFRTAGLQLSVYTPQLYRPSVSFSFASWASFAKIASMPTTGAAMKWLTTAWTAKKKLLDGDSTTSLRFFQERGPASSLVILCIIDPTVRATCSKYVSVNTTLMLGSTMHPDSSITSDLISGNNVTDISYLWYPRPSGTGSWNRQPDGGPYQSAYVVDSPADIQWPNSARLVDVFWSRWLSLLQS